MSDSEIERQKQSYAKGFNQYMARYRARSILEHRVGRTCLDVGCGEGDVTALLADHFDSVVGIDLTEAYIARAKQNVPKARFELVSLEAFETKERFDTIVAVDVLEHVDDPISTLQKLASFLSPKGRILVVVPNAASLHRRIGKAMGMIQDLTEMQEHDIAVGHRRYYTVETLRADVERSGLVLSDRAGILMKMFANARMETLEENYIDALYEVGRDLPDICAEILAVISSRV